jgi:nicotinamide-nucleotide amidase
MSTSSLAHTAIGLLLGASPKGATPSNPRGERTTIATAESLTGGLVAAALTSVPGASAVFVGGIIAYSAELKAQLLDVPAELLDRVGTVDPDVAAAMASGARRRLGAAIGIATTGVAGPDPVDGKPVGTVHVAVSFAERELRLPLKLEGDRAQIRHDTVRHALRLLVAAIE